MPKLMVYCEYLTDVSDNADKGCDIMDDNLLGSKPVHVQVRELLAKRMAEMPVGARLDREVDLAEEFKVSRSSVRLALSGLEEEGYLIRHRSRGTFLAKPIDPDDVSACAPDTSVTNTSVGLLVSDTRMSFHSMIMSGFGKAATLAGYSMFLYESTLDHDNERKILKNLRGRQDLAGLAVLPYDTDSFDPDYSMLIRDIMDSGIKVVLVDQYLSDMEIPVVAMNKVRMGYMATQHLIMLGHERICYVCGASYDTAGRDCVVGYKRALKDYDIEFDADLIIDIPPMYCAVPTRDAIIEKLTANPRAFTAVATPWFSTTHGVLGALQALKLRAPEDIAVVGGDVYENPDMCYVTHTLQDPVKMGEEAFKLLAREDEGDEPTKLHQLLKPTLVIGETCGARK